MGKITGYIAVSEHRGVKYYYLPTVSKWVLDFKKVSLADIKDTKIKIDMSEFPLLESYTHETITIESNYWD